MLRDLLSAASGAIGAAKKGVDDAVSALKKLGDNLATRAANAADLGRMLDILDKVPGIDFEKREPDAPFLTAMMVAIQTGELTLVITCSGKNTTDVDILRMRPLSAKDADVLIGARNFSATVLAEGEEGHPAIQMLVNKENLTQNYRYVSADALVAGLMLPIENIRFIGPLLGRPLRAVVHPVAQFILGAIFTQAETIIQYTRGAKPVPSQAPALPAPEALVAETSPTQDLQKPDLAQVERHIAEASAAILRQEDMIAQLDHGDTAQERTQLEEMRQSLALQEQHRDRIRRELQP